MVSDPPNIVPLERVCEGCVIGKQTKKPFPVGKSKRANDYSRMSWVYFLQVKSETFEHFKKFKALVEKQTGEYLKALRTDHGGEFLSNEFLDFCDEHEAVYNETSDEFDVEPSDVDPEGNSMKPRRSERGRIPRRRFPVEGEDEAQLVLFSGDPSSVREAMRLKEWREAMELELQSIERNQTWVLVNRPEGKNIIGLKWIFKTKYLADGSIEKRKARLVVRGYAQKQGIDYEETFAPVARFETVRVILALAAQKHWKVFQFDVKSAFLNGELEEEVYVTPTIRRFKKSLMIIISALKVTVIAIMVAQLTMEKALLVIALCSGQLQFRGAQINKTPATSCQALWLRRLMSDLGMKQLKATEVFCDNRSAVMLAKNPVFHNRTKHIDIKHHFIRELMAKGEVKIVSCRSEEQLADIMTKSLPYSKHEDSCTRLGMMEFE
ncbi:retrovirus-related pol polyprotein from transposon TNT 1-94 [Tanacetum coccineum]